MGEEKAYPAFVNIGGANARCRVESGVDGADWESVAIDKATNEQLAEAARFEGQLATAHLERAHDLASDLVSRGVPNGLPVELGNRAGMILAVALTLQEGSECGDTSLEDVIQDYFTDDAAASRAAS